MVWAQERSPFVDIPPCHWAADAVGRIAGEPEVTQARTSNLLAENSVQQVFEGLKCNNLEWSAYFLRGVPTGTVPQGNLTSFGLSNVVSSLSGDTGTVTFDLTAQISGQTYTRSAGVDLTFEEGRWLVDYGDLAALDLPVFP